MGWFSNESLREITVKVAKFLEFDVGRCKIGLFILKNMNLFNDI